MITNEPSFVIDYGLSFIFDGNHYVLLSDNNTKEYPVGGLICEYCRLAPTKIKEVILACSNLDCDTTVDNICTVFTEFHSKLFEVFPPVTATLISLEFQNGILDWTTAIRENRIDELINIFQEDKETKKFIFDGTPHNDIGCRTVLQTLLSVYYGFAYTYAVTYHMFEQIIGLDEINIEQQDQAFKAHANMCSDLIGVQHIDYRIIALEDGIHSLYTVKSSISLLLFEIANYCTKGGDFHKCPNCNHVFVPEGRSDTLYCSYPSPLNKEKTCKEIGAQVARANKEKTDIVTGEYRKAYMRYKMITRRHPYDKEKRKTFDALTEGMKSWRVKLANGSATTQEFLEWIHQF